jgi:hypothetical protein
MDKEEKVAAGVFGVIVIGAVAVALFLWKKPAGALQAISPAKGGWSNEERLEIVRNPEGFIDHMVVHRDVQNQ